jgi:HEAT repeat protein
MEKATYTRGVTVGDRVVIHKHYEMKADPTAGAPGVSLTGDGQITFDMKEGLPLQIEFKGALVLTQANNTSRLPITVHYGRLAGAERDRALNPPPPPKPEQKPFTDADLTQALADLKGPDTNKRRAALGRLKTAKPTARRAEVARALGEALTDKDAWTKRECLQALAVWGTSENVPQILPLVADADLFTRGDAIRALGKIGDARAAEAIARRLADGFDRIVAAEALKALGSKAEKAVVSCLDHPEWIVRLEACKVLEAIGTKESKAALEKASSDTNGLVAIHAKRALEAVGKRP